MYYLIEHTDKLKVVDCFLNPVHQSVILNKYCRSNNIKHVANRQAINESRQDGLYTYRESENKYIVLDCKYHQSGYFMNEYTEKIHVSTFEFIYFIMTAPSITYCFEELKKLKCDYRY